MASSHPTKTVARDVFLYLLMISVLASSAGALGTVLFLFINRYVPGVDAGYYGVGDIRSSLQFPLATLVVMFPVLVWVIRFLKRDMAKDPAKRELKIRKWLLYLTLFVAGLTLLGDLVALVFGFMQGNTTLRFLLEVLVILWIAGSVFYYFLKDLHNQARVGRRIVGWIAVIVVVASLVAGFWITGGPGIQRARNNDNRRVSDLQMLESQVVSYWQAKGKLPAALSSLADGTIGGSVPPPTDPKTKAPYTYQVTGPLNYRLCAVFETSTISEPSSAYPYPYAEAGFISVWRHDVGEQCFDGRIDPDRYPSLRPKTP